LGKKRGFIMLVLNRRIGQRLFIDHDIIITIIDATSHQVRIGIEAPSDIKILREELSNRDLPSDELPKDQS
jgi:carbon storage regulator